MYHSNKKIDKCIHMLFFVSILVAGFTATSIHNSKSKSSIEQVSILEKQDTLISKSSSSGIILDDNAKESVEIVSIMEETLEDKQDSIDSNLETEIKENEEEKVEVEQIDYNVEREESKQIEVKASIENNREVEDKEQDVVENNIEENAEGKTILEEVDNDIDKSLIEKLEKYLLENPVEISKYNIANIEIENKINMKEFFENVDNKTLEKLKIMKCFTKKVKG